MITMIRHRSILLASIDCSNESEAENIYLIFFLKSELYFSRIYSRVSVLLSNIEPLICFVEILQRGKIKNVTSNMPMIIHSFYAHRKCCHTSLFKLRSILRPSGQNSPQSVLMV